mmetsp:Transcript_32169/g.48550  ORF Transcript_32169/g.48550 Transcript_32169/m.48550 type:complete len:219 (-) Transcript_32169:105-761(-)
MAVLRFIILDAFQQANQHVRHWKMRTNPGFAPNAKRKVSKRHQNLLDKNHPLKKYLVHQNVIPQSEPAAIKMLQTMKIARPIAVKSIMRWMRKERKQRTITKTMKHLTARQFQAPIKQDGVFVVILSKTIHMKLMIFQKTTLASWQTPQMMINMMTMKSMKTKFPIGHQKGKSASVPTPKQQLVLKEKRRENGSERMIARKRRKRGRTKIWGLLKRNP